MYPNIVDFSAALPWVLAGLLAGFILSWFWSLLRRPAPEPPMADPRDLYKAETDALRATNERLQADYGYFQTALADAEGRASLNGELKQKIAMLSNAELSSRNEARAVQAALEKLRSDAQATGARTHTLEDEARRSQMEIARLREVNDAKDAELGKLKSDLHRVGLAMQSQTDRSDETGRYVADIERLTAEIADRDRIIDESKESHSKIASELVRTREDLMTVKAENENSARAISEGMSRDYDKAIADLAAAYDQINALERQVADLQSSSAANGEGRAPRTQTPPRTMYVSSGAARPPRVARGTAASATGPKKFRIRSSDISRRTGLLELAELRAKVDALSEKTEELRELTLKGE